MSRQILGGNGIFVDLFSPRFRYLVHLKPLSSVILYATEDYQSNLVSSLFDDLEYVLCSERVFAFSRSDGKQDVFRGKVV
jgi:hypothetical protein